MIKRLLLLMLLPVFVLSVGAVPNIVLENTHNVPYTFPSIEIFSETVAVNGEIIDGEKREIYLSLPIFAENVTVSIGDTVQQGQVMATIDQKVTRAVATSSMSISNSSSEFSEDTISAIADQYGIPSSFIAQYIPKERTEKSVIGRWEEEKIPKEIIAPMTGVITQSNLQENVMTDPGSPLVTIASMEHFKAKLAVPEEEIQHIEIGDRVEVSSPSFPATCRGEVSKIYPVAENNFFETGKAVMVETDIRTGFSQLKPGFSVNGSIFIGEAEELLTIPYEAIAQDDQHQEYVYVYSQGRPVRRNITTGKELLHTVEVIDGLNVSDIVLLNPEKLRPNMLVTLKGEFHVD